MERLLWKRGIGRLQRKGTERKLEWGKVTLWRVTRRYDYNREEEMEG